MRTLLALLLSWLMPSTGKRRAQTADQISTPDTADTPTPRLIITPSALGVEQPSHRPPLPRRPQVLRGEDVALIRPYLIAWEQEQERRRQRDRRRAAVLATLGQDCPASMLGGWGVTA